MKRFLCLSSISLCSWAMSPTVETKIEKNNLIHVLAKNDEKNSMNCDWVVSYFENGFNFKRHFGYVVIASKKQTEISLKNDPYSKINGIKTHFECN